jgi:putative transposase
MPRSRYRIFDNPKPHFLTCTIVGWLPLLSRPPIAQIVLDSWRFLQDHDRLELYAYVIVESHVHLIASSGDLAKEMGDLSLSRRARSSICSPRRTTRIFCSNWRLTS